MFTEGPANTALLTAAARAAENEMDNPLVVDPYAAALAGEEGKKLLELWGPAFTLVETIRTKFFDDAILNSAKSGKKQFVILGSGLDTRPYRLNLPSDILWFEVDFGPLLEYKRKILKDKTPTINPIDVQMDVTKLDLQRDFVSKGFNPSLPSVWVAEGLVPYLTDRQVDVLLDLVSNASTSGSDLHMTCPSKKLIEVNGETSSNYQFMKNIGTQYQFSGSDHPDELVGKHGYKTDIVFVGHRRAHFGMLPIPPLDTLPENFVAEWFIRGIKI